MAKLIIEGELSQLLKIQKAQRLLEARKIVKCTLEENKDQESIFSSPESETLPEIDQEQINEVIEANEESVNEQQEVNESETEVENVDEITEEQVIEQQETIDKVEDTKVPEVPNVEKKKAKGRPAKKVK